MSKLSVAKLQIKNKTDVQNYFFYHLKFILEKEAQNNLYFFEYAMLYIYLKFPRKERCSPYHILHKPASFLKFHKLLTEDRVRELNPGAIVDIAIVRLNKKLSTRFVEYPDVLQRVVNNICKTIGEGNNNIDVELWKQYIILAQTCRFSPEVLKDTRNGTSKMVECLKTVNELHKLHKLYENDNIGVNEDDIEKIYIIYEIIKFLCSNEGPILNTEFLRNTIIKKFRDEYEGKMLTDVIQAVLNAIDTENSVFDDKLATCLVKKIVINKNRY